jgi:RNA polymerase sigma-70 factor (ECF subfamily)
MIDSLSSFRWKGVSFLAWLYRIAHNLIVDLLRRRSSRTIEALESAEEVTSGSDIEEELVGRMEEQDLRRAILHLPERYREVIYLKFQQGLSNREVAVIMNMSSGAVNSLRFRAIRALSESLTGRDEK